MGESRTSSVSNQESLPPSHSKPIKGQHRMDGLGEYIELVLKNMKDAKWETPAKLKARGYGATRSLPENSAVPLGTIRALPGDYAYAWQVVMCIPPLLVQTDHQQTDFVLMIIHAIHRVYVTHAGTKDGYQQELATMMTEAEDFRNKLAAAHEANNEAKHRVQMHARYQKNLQARAKRALEDYHGGADGYEKEEYEWNCAIGFAGRSLIDKGLVYADTKAKLMILQKWRVERTEYLMEVQGNETHVRAQLLLYAIPEFQYVLGKVKAILNAMKSERGDDESTWRLNEVVEAIMDEIEQHFVELGNKGGRDLSFDALIEEEDDEEDEDEEDEDEEDEDEEDESEEDESEEDEDEEDDEDDKEE